MFKNRVFCVPKKPFVFIRVQFRNWAYALFKISEKLPPGKFPSHTFPPGHQRGKFTEVGRGGEGGRGIGSYL